MNTDDGADMHDSRTETEVSLHAGWTRRIREGDPGAFEALFRAFHPKLVRFAASIVKDDAIAADVVQEAFVKLWDGRDGLDEKRSIQSLLFRAVRNRCLNVVRDRDNRRELMASGPIPLPKTENPEHRLRASAFGEQLESWISGLPPRQEEALRLSRFEGLNHDEIAEVMGCSPRTVNNHLVQALRRLRAQVAEHAPELLGS